MPYPTPSLYEVDETPYTTEPIYSELLPKTEYQEPSYFNDQPPSYANDQPSLYANDHPPIYANEHSPIYANNQPFLYANDQLPLYSDIKKTALTANQQPPLYENGQSHQHNKTAVDAASVYTTEPLYAQIKPKTALNTPAGRNTTVTDDLTGSAEPVAANKFLVNMYENISDDPDDIGNASNIDLVGSLVR